MRSLILMVAALALCVCALLAACSPQDGSAPVASSRAPTVAGDDTAAQTKPTPAPPADQTRRINIQETQKEVADGTAIIVDVRDEGSYKASHIKGARNIPLPQFEQRMSELPKDKLIITYCA